MALKRVTMLGLFFLAACGSSKNGSGELQPAGGRGGTAPQGAAGTNGAAGASSSGGVPGSGGIPGQGGVPGSGAGGTAGGPSFPGAGGGAGSGSGGGGTAGGPSFPGAGGGAGSSLGGGGGTGGGPRGGGPGPSPSGGAGGQGAGGDTGQVLLLPSSCQARSQSTTPYSCTLSAYCDGIPYITACQLVDDTRWQCASQTRYPGRIYEVEGVAGVQPCAVVTGVSAQDPLTLGADSCVTLTNVTGADNCSASLVCGPSVAAEFAPGVRVRLARYGEIECSSISSPQTIDCELRFDESTRNELGVFSDTLACQSILEFSMLAAGPGFVGPRSCLTTEKTSTADGCQRNELCSLPAPTTEAPGYPTVEGRYADCEPASGGGAACYCSAGESLFMFHIASAADDGACADTITSCEPSAAIEATGDPTCQPTSHTTGADSCEADLDCTQPATIDGRAVVADGRLLVQCARLQQGRPWSCTCASDQLTASFSLGTATATPAQACAQAPQACLQHIPVHLGPYGPVVSPPEPAL